MATPGLTTAQLPTSASFAAMAAAAGLTQFTPGSVSDFSTICSEVVCFPRICLNNVCFVFRGALLSLTPGGLGSALSPLMNNSTLAAIQGVC